MDKIKSLVFYPLTEDEPLVFGEFIHDGMKPEHEVIRLLVDNKIVKYKIFDSHSRGKFGEDAKENAESLSQK